MHTNLVQSEVLYVHTGFLSNRKTGKPAGHHAGHAVDSGSHHSWLGRKTKARAQELWHRSPSHRDFWHEAVAGIKPSGDGPDGDQGQPVLVASQAGGLVQMWLGI